MSRSGRRGSTRSRSPKLCSGAGRGSPPRGRATCSFLHQQRPIGPSGPSGPRGPGSPSAPAGPFAPGGPCQPIGPQGPGGPGGPAKAPERAARAARYAPESAPAPRAAMPRTISRTRSRRSSFRCTSAARLRDEVAGRVHTDRVEAGVAREAPLAGGAVHRGRPIRRDRYPAAPGLGPAPRGGAVPRPRFHAGAALVERRLPVRAFLPRRGARPWRG